MEREEGAFLGSLSISYGVTGVLCLALLVVWLIVDSPDVQLLRLGIAAGVVSIVVPFIFYPFAKTIWAAIDFLLQEGDVSAPGRRDPPP